METQAASLLYRHTASAKMIFDVENQGTFKWFATGLFVALRALSRHLTTPLRRELSIGVVAPSLGSACHGCRRWPAPKFLSELCHQWCWHVRWSLKSRSYVLRMSRVDYIHGLLSHTSHHTKCSHRMHVPCEKQCCALHVDVQAVRWLGTPKPSVASAIPWKRCGNLCSFNAAASSSTQ
jgi:hypothetical protein